MFLVVVLTPNFFLKHFILEFENIVQETTDFHFPSFEQQKCLIEQTLSQRKSRSRTLRTSSISRNKQAETTNKLLQTGINTALIVMFK